MKERVIAAIKRGEVVVLPLEHSYVYACDAFSFSAVNRLHQLRNDPAGVASQVIISKVATLEGLAQVVPAEVKKLATAFWPGLLTFKLLQSRTLSWDLGDGGVLNDFAVRAPNQIETLDVILQTGPLAIGSAVLAGQAPTATAPRNPNLEILNIGQLAVGQLSTLIDATTGKLELIRSGALTLEDLQKVESAISAIKEVTD